MGELRPYQQAMLDAVRQAYRDGARRPCLVLPCGGGKSVIAAEMARLTTLRGKRVLYLVHRRELCGQIRRTFADWGVVMHLCDVMMVQTAARRLAGTATKAARNGEAYSPARSRVDTGSRGELSGGLAARGASHGGLAAPGLIITDENHHCLAASYRRIYDAFPDVPCVGVTATPQRLSGGGLGDVNDRLIEGVTAHWLIGHGYLAPYDYFAPSVTDLTGLRSSHGEYIASDIAARMNRQAIHGDVIAHWRRLADGRKTICYCASREHSRAVAAAYCAAGVRAAHLDGDTPERERTRTVEAFRRGEITVLSNVDLISEGFDVPDCSCAVLLRPTKSLALYIQQSMRPMRYRPGKRAVILDHVGNYARFGLPDADRTWTLDPKHTKKQDKAPPVRQCPQCFATFEPADVCPLCGYRFPARGRTVEEIREAALEKIEGFTLCYDSPAQCRDYAELRTYGRQKGYKPGWAWIMAKKRGFL